MKIILLFIIFFVYIEFPWVLKIKIFDVLEKMVYNSSFNKKARK